MGNLAYASATKKLLKRALDHDIPITMARSSMCSPHSNDDGTSIIFDVTFVDDEAIAVMAAVPKTLRTKLVLAIQLLVDTFEEYGMTINWAPGKTEALVCFRGKGQKDE